MSELSPKLTPPVPAYDGTGDLDTAALDTFNARFAEYLQWNERGQGPLIADRGKKVSIAIYKLYRQQAEPNKAALRAKIAAEAGYRLRRRARRDDSGKAVSWRDEIGLRASGNAVLATSWLHDRWRSNNAVGRFLRTNRRRRLIGSADVDAAEGNANPSVRLTSYLAGAIALNQERALVSQALFYQAADMAVYIERKHAEFLARRLVGDFRTTIEI
jgi:hypothetical protein